MRILPLVLTSLVLLTGAAPAQPEDSPAAPKRSLLRGADCLDPAAARSWHYVDGDELLVDAGRRKYRIGLSGFCTELGGASELQFRGDAISGRICGNAGERLQFGGSHCRIDRIELIDAKTYRDASESKQGSVSATRTVD